MPARSTVERSIARSRAPQAWETPQTSETSDASESPQLVGRTERWALRGVRLLQRHPRLRRVALHPAVTAPGFAAATFVALVWWALLGSGRLRRSRGMLVADRMPRWAFGRAGTMIGAVLLTRGAPATRMLAHEAVHRRQWRRFGLLFLMLYLAAGRDPLANRFEIEAGLADGGYRASPRD